MEEWKVIPGFERYEVNIVGEIRNVKTKRTLRSNLFKGYLGINIMQSVNVRRHMKSHNAVMRAFFGPCPEGMQVNHIDGNKLNNALHNLEYVTIHQNVMHAIEVLGKHKRGENNGRARLTESDIREIRRLASEKVTHREIGLRFGIGPKYVNRITSRHLWRHI